MGGEGSELLFTLAKRLMAQLNSESSSPKGERLESSFEFSKSSPPFEKGRTGGISGRIFSRREGVTNFSGHKTALVSPRVVKKTASTVTPAKAGVQEV